MIGLMCFPELDTLLFVRKICSYEITWERKNLQFRMVWCRTLSNFPWNGFIQACKHGEIKNVISWNFWKFQTEASQEKTAQLNDWSQYLVYILGAGFFGDINNLLAFLPFWFMILGAGFFGDINNTKHTSIY